MFSRPIAGIRKIARLREASCFSLMFSDHGMVLNEELLFRADRLYPSPPCPLCSDERWGCRSGWKLDGSSHGIFLMTRRSVSGSLHQQKSVDGVANVYARPASRSIIEDVHAASPRTSTEREGGK
jgi:hypothetical protein